MILLKIMIGEARADPVTPAQHNSDIWDKVVDAMRGFILARKSFAQFVDQLSQLKETELSNITRMKWKFGWNKEKNG